MGADDNTDALMGALGIFSQRVLTASGCARLAVDRRAAIRGHARSIREWPGRQMETTKEDTAQPRAVRGPHSRGRHRYQ